MATFKMGHIALFPSERTPNNWASCNGQTMPIRNNQALYAIIGTKYGGNGGDTFAVPSSKQLPDIGRCRHLICTEGSFSFGAALPYIEASEDEYEKVMGFITETSGNVPDGWLLCDGRMLDLAISENQPLFAIIGDTFGGEGNNKFALPNLNSIGDKKYVICVSGQFPSFS